MTKSFPKFCKTSNEEFDAEKKHAVYGFGAKLPPSYPSAISDCFALTGDFFSPWVQGVKGLEEQTVIQTRMFLNLARRPQRGSKARIIGQPHKGVTTTRPIDKSYFLASGSYV